MKGESRNLTRMNEGKLSEKWIHKYRIYSCDVKWFSSLSITVSVVYRVTFPQQGLPWMLCFLFVQSGLFALFAHWPLFQVLFQQYTTCTQQQTVTLTYTVGRNVCSKSILLEELSLICPWQNLHLTPHHL